MVEAESPAIVESIPIVAESDIVVVVSVVVPVEQAPASISKPIRYVWIRIGVGLGVTGLLPKWLYQFAGLVDVDFEVLRIVFIEFVGVGQVIFAGDGG